MPKGETRTKKSFDSFYQHANILLTGPSGAGKSTLAKGLAELGWQYLDGDALARDLYLDPRLKRALKRAFGAEILQTDGSVNRVRLGEIVFSSLTHRRRLDALVHPPFLRALKGQLKALARNSAPIVADVAVYFAMGAPRLGLPVMLVDAPLASRIRRLRRRGLSLGRARLQAKALAFSPADRRRCFAVLDGRRPKQALLRDALGAMAGGLA